MKRITIGLVITLCTFIVGICAVAVWLINQPISAISPVIENIDVKPQTVKTSSVPNEATNAEALCNRISEIKYLHPKNETGYDKTYDTLIKAGDRVVPCLIQKITDTTIMPDPRGTRISQETKVGDVAYFVLIDITKLDFTEMLPDKIKQKYGTEGVYAYHDYIERKGNRKKLQLKLRQWYQEKSSKIPIDLIQQLITDINTNENNFHLSKEDLEILNNHLKYELDDSNNDGIREYFLYIDHSDWCGVGSNCSYWIYQKTETGYKLLLEDKVLRVKDTVTNSYRDLWSETPMGFCARNVQRLDITPYKFDGKEYQPQKAITECRTFKPKQN